MCQFITSSSDLLMIEEVEFSTKLFCVDIRILLDWPARADRKVSTWRTTSVRGGASGSSTPRLDYLNFG